MMTDLLTDKICFTSSAIIFPLSKKQFPQERIQRFLLAAEFVTSTRILLFQGSKEPLEDKEGSFCGVWFFCWRDQY